MKKHILFWALICSSCWGFGQSRLVKNLQSGKSQTLVVYGTSITQMGNGPVWVQAVGNELNRLYANKLTLMNTGKSGECSEWGLGNLETNVIASSPDAVMIEFTTNDAVENKNVSVAKCRENTEAMISRILAVNPNCEIILHTPCGYPIVSSEGSTGGATPRPELAKYNGVYETLAAENGYLWIDEATRLYQMGTDNPDLLKTYAADGVHPTLKGAMGLIYPTVMKTLLTGLSTKDIPVDDSVLFSLNCNYFANSSSSDMSVASAPHNWLSACDRICDSQNTFAQVMTGSNAYLGNCIRFGKSAAGDENCGSLILPELNLKAPDSKKVILMITLASGANKTGALTVELDGIEIGRITATTGNDGAALGQKYYTFRYEIQNATFTSRLRFIHSREAAGGFIYVNSISIYRTDDPITGLPESTLIQPDPAVYPNPFSSEIYVGTNNSSIMIFNMQGAKIIDLYQPADRIDVQSLNPGSYVMIKKDKNGNVSAHKLSKIH